MSAAAGRLASASFPNSRRDRLISSSDSNQDLGIKNQELHDEPDDSRFAIPHCIPHFAFGASYTLNCCIDHGGAFSVVAVCVNFTNFACTGLNAMAVVAPSPLPTATCVHAVPFVD